MSEAGTRPDDQRDSLDIVGLLILLGTSKRRLLTWAFVGTVVAALASVIIPSTYTGVTRTLVPQQGQSLATAMLSQLGGLANLAGGASGIKNPGDIYISMLKSVSVTDRMIDRFKLAQRYRVTLRTEARDRLLASSRFAADRNGILTIETDDKDPATAATMANAYVDELYELTKTLAITEAAQRRLFFERQLADTRDRLASLESKGRSLIDVTGFASLETQGRATAESIAKLRMGISAKEVEIGAMSSYAGKDNPEMHRARQELASLRQELARLEVGTLRPPPLRPESSASAAVETGREDTVRLLREVKYNQALLEQLSKQYEIARLDESKEAPVIQVMDRAQIPERRSSPRRLQMTLLGLVMGLLAGVLATLIDGALTAVRRDPAKAEALMAVRRAWLEL